MTDVLGDDTEFSELVDANVPRVDLVGRPANGSPGFLLMKQEQDAGLLDADTIRELLAKSEPEPAAPEKEETVTMSGSPAAIAKLMHEAAVRKNDDVTKVVVAEPQETEDDLDLSVILAEPEGGLPPGSYMDPGSAAWEAIDAATARKWTAILARAKHALDVMADREDVEAATGDDDDADSADDLETAADAIDYAIGILAPFAVGEQAEADVKAEEMNAVGKALAAFDPAPLDTIEALAQVTKAGRVLSDANERAIRTAAEHLQKVLASLPAAPAAPVEKESGQQVAKTANEEPNMPTPTLSEDAVEASGQQPAMGTAEAQPESMEKAAAAQGKTPMIVVYDQKGSLIGIVDPAEVTPVANSGAGTADASGGSADSGASSASGGSADAKSASAPAASSSAAAADSSSSADTTTTTADDGSSSADSGTSSDSTGGSTGATDGSSTADATSQTTDLTPQPAADAGTPTDAAPDDPTVTKSASEMLKSNATGPDAAATDDQSATHETIAKQAAALEELADVVETLKAQVKALEEQPAEPRVFTNGAQPPRDLRGMDRGAFPADVVKAQERRRSMYRASDASEQNRLANEMQAEAIAALQEIQRR